MTNEEKINLIGQKILLLSNNLNKYQEELKQLKQQLDALQQQQPNAVKQPAFVPPIIKTPEPIAEIRQEIKEEIPVEKVAEVASPVNTNYQIPTYKPKRVKESSFNFEEFVGGKLITIIGIVILVIGLGIGVKYAIDNDMLGPLARLVLAYAAGGILLGLAFKLKAKYKPFSAVLLSGAMASLYFTTFAAYSMYALFPQMAAFAIMVIFTAFTVFAATIYDLEVIGVIGLAGAYGVPMLLSDGTGRIEIMFAYMLIINIGILFLSFKKYWQILNHVSYGFTWLIVGGWVSQKFDYEVHALMTLSFAFLFFLIFYISNMAYKIIKKELFGMIDIIRILSNSFIFFGIGYYALNNKQYEQYLGLFTVANALVHLVFSYIVFKNKMLDRKLFYLLVAMVLCFITIAVPVQLEGHWVTLFWSAEAVLLFAIGRIKAVRFYEWLGFIMVVLGLFSLMHDWSKTYYESSYFVYDNFKYWTPFLNIHLFTSLFYTASVGVIIYLHHGKALKEGDRKEFQIYSIIDYALPILLLLITYLTFSNEISATFSHLYQISVIKVPSKDAWAAAGTTNEVYDSILLNYKDVVLEMYNLVFIGMLALLTITKWKQPVIRWIAFGLNILSLLIFLFTGLDELARLRDEYLLNPTSVYYDTSGMPLYIHYVSFALYGLVVYLIYKLLKTDTFNKFTIRKIYSGCIVHFFILVLLCNELLNYNHINNYGTEANFSSEENVWKLGFTVLWGAYSFLLIAIGIFKKNKVMRISSISLFGITILKLLLVDTWDLSTGYKVISYMLLGAILLIVAFLYQKFKVLIFGDDASEKEKITTTESEN
jgi:uncharacterized membrane protein